MNDFEQFDLRPIYCILRSALEKYTDILNLFTHGDNYHHYLNYLNLSSQAMLERSESKNANASQNKADEFQLQVKNLFKQDKCNGFILQYECNVILSFTVLQLLPNHHLVIQE